MPPTTPPTIEQKRLAICCCCGGWQGATREEIETYWEQLPEKRRDSYLHRLNELGPEHRKSLEGSLAPLTLSTPQKADADDAGQAEQPTPPKTPAAADVKPNAGGDAAGAKKGGK